MMSKSAYLHCLFADDVRSEMGGQLSLIGVYQGGLKVTNPPQVLPKFAIFANLFLPLDQEFHALTLKVLWNDETLHTVTLPETALSEARTQAISTDKANGYGIQAAIQLTGFLLKGEGRIRVVAQMDGMELFGNALEVQVQQTNDPKTSSSPM